MKGCKVPRTRLQECPKVVSFYHCSLSRLYLDHLYLVLVLPCTFALMFSIKNISPRQLSAFTALVLAIPIELAVWLCGKRLDHWPLVCFA